jgi:hypothetical protein
MVYSLTSREDPKKHIYTHSTSNDEERVNLVSDFVLIASVSEDIEVK